MPTLSSFLSLLVVGFISVTSAVAAEPTKVVIIAGAKSHPSGQHEFAAGATLLAKALNEQSGLPVKAVIVTNGWPKDESVLEGAKSLVCYADGGDKHPFLGHLEKVDALAAKGVGIMCMHYGVEVPVSKAGEQFQRWIGGYYQGGFSTNPHWDAEGTANADHPVGRGVSPVKVHDEWYFNIRFPDPTSVTPLLTATPTRPLIKRYIHWTEAGEQALGKAQSLMWGLQREDGGRGIGFTGGHWHRNWAIDDYRKIVLNAIIWSAGLEVPEGGVKSLPISEAELNLNLDVKEPMVHIKAPSPDDFKLPEAPAIPVNK